MKSIEESRLVFEYDETTCQCIKFDENIAYKRVEKRLKPTCGVDFIFLFNGEKLVLTEVKNFREHTKDPESKEKLEDNAEKLVTSIALKVRDTLACGFASSRFSTNDPDFWKRFHTAFIHGVQPVVVVAWIEFDGKSDKEKKAKMNIWNNKLKEKLHWIQSIRTTVNNTDFPPPENVLDIQARLKP